MEKFYSRIRNFKLPKRDEINLSIASFTQKERIVFSILVLVLFLSTISMVQSLNKKLMVSVPLPGGTISEGIIGAPRFVNPVLASSQTDLDMVSLVYSGLMRKNADGTFIPDLAENYKMSEDGLSYTFTLKDKIYFHDGTPVTAEDVLFTISQVKDPLVKSPRRIDWEGVTANQIDDKTVEFNLRKPYPSFLNSTTIGILPRALWDSSPIELNETNISPVGSGPYKIESTSKESSGTVNSYELAAFKKFALGKPYIQKIIFNFYLNEDDLVKALEEEKIDQISSVTPLNADILKERNYQVNSSVLPRIFGLFFNQNKNQIFTDKTIVWAINKAIDKEKVVREVLFGYGSFIDGPIPPNMIAYQKLATENNASREEILESVASNLAKAGWTKGEDGFLQKTTTDKNKKQSTAALEFSISTGNTPDLVKTAELIAKDLQKVGIKVDIKTFEVGNLNQNVIRPREYDALLFGQIINKESDLFAFWHSSQRLDPGLNVALYTNTKVDKLLEEAAITINTEQRTKKYAQFESEVKKDMPAVFLYSPDFIYIVSPKVKGISIDHINSPTDRFANVYLWYIQTENVWKIFVK